MPIYEYVCTNCKERIEVKAKVSEKEKGLNVSYPKCGSKKMAQVFGNFFVGGSSGSKNNPLIC